MDIKKIAIIVIVVLAVALGAVFIFKGNNSSIELTEEEKKIYANPIATVKTDGIYQIYNTDITTDTGATVITADVKNVSGSKTSGKNVKISLVDEEGNEVGQMVVYVPALEVDDIAKVKSQNLNVIENIYDYKIIQ